MNFIVSIKTYCVSCKQNTANENSSVKKTNKNRLMLLSHCVLVARKHNFNNI